MNKVQEVREKMQKALKDARDVCDLCEKEKRNFTAEEREKVGKLLAEAKQHKDELAKLEGDEALGKAVLELGAGIELNERQGGGQPGQPGVPAGRGKSLGEQFVEAPSFKAWLAQIAPGGAVPDQLKGIHSPPIEFKGLGRHVFGRKDLITGADDTSAGAFVRTDYTGIYEPLGRWPLTMRDLISVRQTASDLVEFVRQTQQVTEAAPTPEANVKEPSGATGEISGEKPQGALYFEKVHAAVKTIAVWVAATKRALSDAAQIRGIIDQELRDDLGEELENQICNGNGVGENLTGIANTAGTLVQAFNTDILTTTRQAITTAMVTGRSRPTAWVFNPVDWETVELLRDVAGRFYFAGPGSLGPKRLWGLPVVECFQKAQGTAWLGDWRKAVLWDREQASISVTDSHADFFIRNIIAILAEMRAAFALVRPSGFVEVALA